jgi:hypothetical protein
MIQNRRTSRLREREITGFSVPRQEHLMDAELKRQAKGIIDQILQLRDSL